VIDVLGVGGDHQLFHSYWDPSAGWSGWGALGGALSGRPSSVSRGPGVLDVYMRGTDNQLYQKYWSPSGRWSDFVRLGGSLTSGVSATSWDANRRDIFVRGPGNAVYDDSFQSPSWVGFSAFDGAVTSGPGATSVRPGRLAMVARNGEFIVLRNYAGSWTGWINLGRAPLYTAPAAPAPAPPAPTPAELRLRAGFGCIPVGGRVPVRVRVYQRSGRLKPRIIKVVFFIDRGKRRRTDRHKPYKTRIRVTFKRGSKHRVHARIYFRRQGQKRVQRKTVSKRFTMCS
jgi:hypothetical protein